MATVRPTVFCSYTVFARRLWMLMTERAGAAIPTLAAVPDQNYGSLVRDDRGLPRRSVPAASRACFAPVEPS